MQFERLSIAGPVLITPKRHGDARGFFMETWRKDLFAAHVGAVEFVQDNHSRSAKRGTLRGLHYQRPPHAQGKLVRVTRGAVFDVVVDLRHGSPDFGKHVAVELSEENGRQLWIPQGFLHGFLTLADDTEFLYKVTGYYNAGADAAVAYDDPDIGIAWPIAAAELTLSDKDRAAPRLKDLPPLFRFEEKA